MPRDLRSPTLGTRIVLATGVAIVVGWLWLTDLPLGVPGEWTWPRIVAAPEDLSDRWLGLLAATIAAAGLLFVVWLGLQRIERASRFGVALRLTGLSAAGFGWLWVVQDAPPGERRLQKAPLVLYAPSTSGYYFHDRFHIDEAAAFLRGYEDWTRRGDVLHFGTHPPGLFLFHRGLAKLCEASPALTRFLLWTRPASALEAFALIDRTPMGARRGLTDAERAALWLAALVTQAAAALTVIPLYGLMRRTASRRAAWLGASLWLFVPALAVFLPKSDTLYPPLATLIVWCGLEAASRRSIVLGAMTGTLLFGGLFLTLAFLPVAVLTVVAALAEQSCRGRLGSAADAPQDSRRARAILSIAAPWLAGLVALVGWVLAVRFALDLNLPAVWRQNLVNHAGFYDQYPRTKWLWLLVNPIETAFAVGWPLCFLGVRSAWRALRGCCEEARSVVHSPSRPTLAAPATNATPSSEAGPNVAARVAALSVAAVAGLLWISCKNSGEAARLWLPMFPWVAWLASLELQRLEGAEPPTSRGTLFRDVALAQAACAVATILRVAGFDFGT